MNNGNRRILTVANILQSKHDVTSKLSLWGNRSNCTNSHLSFI